MTNSLKTGALALALILSSGVNGFAQAGNKSDSDIMVQDAPKKFDARIEAAAIRKAAEKIGDLRGSLNGDPIGEIISEPDLNNDQSTRLGFPIITEPREATVGSVPLV